MRKLTRLFALMMALTMLLGALPALAEEPDNPSGIPYYKVTSDLYDFIDMDGAPSRLKFTASWRTTPAVRPAGALR